MRCRIVLILVPVLACFAVTVLAQDPDDLYLPEVADGTYPGGSMRTAFIILNPTTTPDQLTLELTAQDGSPMVVTIPGLGTGSEFDIVAQPGRTTFLQTDGSGSLEVGAARITRSSDVAQVSAIFTVYDA